MYRWVPTIGFFLVIILHLATPFSANTYSHWRTRRSITRRQVLAASKQSASRTQSRSYGVNVSRRDKDHHNSKPPEADVLTSVRWKQAQHVEASVQLALEAMIYDAPIEREMPFVRFPTVRDCNTAMATFGDGGNFLRALGLFLKMRKATTIAQTNTELLSKWNVPVPTLVTYSTLMSRAVQVGKERLALRLWYLMKTQPRFFSSNQGTKINTMVILPDVKAANILMNVHAKLCDVESAQYLMGQMIYGNGTDVPKLEPNIVTYNSLLDACRRAGDLDAALEAKRQLDESDLMPDARTYTTLIATVGRRASSTSGARDTSMAFAFLNEMINLGIRPNGMTYSALIDACARCDRTDMALKGLRAMLRQKSKEQRAMRHESNRNYLLFNEVGAWTSAINALGKAGRVETAMRLFQAMPKTGVQPNTITCGCLADSLLRHGRTADTLNVLRYMKQEGIAPSEVMYTSLMTSAGRMAEIENKQKWNGKILEDDFQVGDGDTKAIEVYTVLMKSLTEETSKDNPNTQLLKVFLVFQEMKAAGAEPDLACYNALLRACARAGDLNHAMEVLRKIKEDGLIPNNTSWREALKAAEKARRSDLAEEIWRTGLEFHLERKSAIGWKPSADSLAHLLSSYLREASDRGDNLDMQVALYKCVVRIYKDIMTGSVKRKVDKEDLLESARALGMVVRAIVCLDLIQPNNSHKTVLRKIAVSISTLEVWKNQDRIDPATNKALQTAERWRTNTDRDDPEL